MKALVAFSILSLVALAQDPPAATSLTIGTIQDLTTWALAPDQYNDVKLGTDLDLTGQTLTPIGIVYDSEGQPTQECKPWTGTFDGQGFTLKNIKISSLFCNVGEGTIIKNLKIEAGTFDQAAIVPTLESSLTIQDVVLDETTKIGNDEGTVDSAAGLVGTVNQEVAEGESKELLITRVTMGAEIAAKKSVAGLVGTVTKGTVTIAAT